MSTATAHAAPLPLSGSALTLAGVLLAAANFLVVLDLTIANVAVPHIAGGLAVSPTQGTYVITSYAIAEAISVPLTGWLAGRFGMVKTFVVCMIGFGIGSALCGLAPSLSALVAARIFQGLCGGPLMPLSQTLLLRIFPRERHGAALGLWSMTTLVAPIMGPILGGAICDSVGWPSIFYINVPIAIVCGYFGWNLLKSQESPIAPKTKFDTVGLILMIVWVASIELMMDEGKTHDWFSSPFIVILGLTAVIFFVAFLIWELTIENPIVPLHVFKSRGYTAAVITLCVAFAGMFGANVLTPLWLQGYMGYTATSSGYAMAMSGLTAVCVAPIAATLSQKVDPRPLVLYGMCVLGAVAFVRGLSTTDMTFWQVALPLLVMGLGMPFFFIPLTGLALASVDPKDMAGAAGMMNFTRTLSGAFAVSVITTRWENAAIDDRAELVGRLRPEQLPAGVDQSILDQLLQSQAVMLATNSTFLQVSFLFALAGVIVWFAPRPKVRVAGGGGH
jgi:DHA2 family multidrug resistance protein